MDEMEVRRMEVPNAVLLGQVKEAIREGHTATINVKGYNLWGTCDSVAWDGQY